MHLAGCPKWVEKWSVWCPGRNRALAAKEQNGLLSFTSGNAKKWGKTDSGWKRESGNQMRPGRRRKRSWMRMGEKLSLSCCVYDHRRKLPAPEDGLEERPMSQSPVQALLSCDEKQKERCVVGPRGS